MSKFLPNSYQTPNLYVDRLMPLLTGEEWKVLTYAARRIFGFQRGSDRISIGQFSDGLHSRATGENLDHGAGLNETTCRKALESLVRFGVMEKLSEANPGKKLGPEWGLQLDSERVDWAGLERRRLDRLGVAGAKLETARQAREGSMPQHPSDPGKSDKRGLCHNTPRGLCHNTPLGSMPQHPSGASLIRNGKPEESQKESQRGTPAAAQGYAQEQVTPEIQAIRLLNVGGDRIIYAWNSETLDTHAKTEWERQVGGHFANARTVTLADLEAARARAEAEYAANGKGRPKTLTWLYKSLAAVLRGDGPTNRKPKSGDRVADLLRQMEEEDATEDRSREPGTTAR
jgi:hypothetical protein